METVFLFLGVTCVTWGGRGGWELSRHTAPPYPPPTHRHGPSPGHLLILLVNLRESGLGFKGVRWSFSTIITKTVISISSVHIFSSFVARKCKKL